MTYETPFIWKDGRSYIDGKFAYLMYDTHGLPVDMLEDHINILYPPQSVKRGFFIARAYDNAHGTGYSEQFATLHGINADECR